MLTPPAWATWPSAILTRWVSRRIPRLGWILPGTSWTVHLIMMVLPLSRGSTCFAQPDVPQLFNHQDTFSGVKIGQDDYRLKHNVFAPYENSIYGTATGVGISGEHDSTHLHHGRVVHQPYYPRHVVE